MSNSQISISSSASSLRKRHSVALNGEVKIVRSDLVQGGYEKKTKRIEDTIQKVHILAEKEPEIEDKMQEFLIRTKE